MKHKTTHYAKALADVMIDKKSTADSKKISVNFLRLLEKNGDLKRAKEIILLAESIYFKKTGYKKITLETARNVQKEDLLKSFVKKGDVVEEKVRPELIAGIKIIVNGEKQLDNSLLAKLHTLHVTRNN